MNQNEQMTSEQLDELEQRKLSGDHQFISLNREAAKELFTLAREGLQLREEIQTRHSETHYENRVKEIADLTAELEALRKAEKTTSDSYLRIRALVDAWDTNYGGENRFEVTEQKIKDMKAELAALRKDKERLEWVMQNPMKFHHKIFMPLCGGYEQEENAVFRTAIDSAMKEKNV